VLLGGCLKPNPNAEPWDAAGPDQEPPPPDLRQPARERVGRRDLKLDRTPTGDLPRADQTPCSVSCAGCCHPDGACAPGTADNACGLKGLACVDCKAINLGCWQGVCLPTCTPACLTKSCWAEDGCGGICEPGSGCTPCQWGTSGDNGDPCPGVPHETWRCVKSPKLSALVSQVCRNGKWQNFHIGPADCAACCGPLTPGCI
jgi:hypothetical protein